MRLLPCTFPEAALQLAVRAGIDVKAVPSPELVAKAEAKRISREREAKFKQFCDVWHGTLSAHHRKLGQAAVHAQDRLKAGVDPIVAAHCREQIERLREFEVRVEDEGLYTRPTILEFFEREIADAD